MSIIELDLETVPLAIDLVTVSQTLDIVVQQVAISPPSSDNFTVSLGAVRGKQGPSAYEIAVAEGFVGTVAEWLESLEGEQGETGPAGGASTYTHTQNTPSTTWVILHNLGRFPSPTVVDSGGSVVVGDVRYDSSDQITVLFSVEFSGKVYLN